MGAFQARHELPKLREVFLGNPAESFKPFSQIAQMKISLVNIQKSDIDRFHVNF